MLNSIIYASAPLILAAIAALFTELSGFLCIAIEGFMIFGAFFSYIFAGWMGSAFAGTLLSAILVALFGYFIVIFIEKTNSNLYITGLAVNLLAEGVTGTLSQVWFGTGGVIRNNVLNLPSPFKINFGYAKNLSFPPFAVTALFFIILSMIFIKKTVFGYRLRAVGLSAAAARERGLNCGLYRAGSWAAAGFLAALAGAALSFRVGVYAPGGTAGRGWLGLAAVYMGFGDVIGVSLAAVLFAFVEYLTFSAQELSFAPATALMGLPQALALVLYTITALIRKSRKPR